MGRDIDDKCGTSWRKNRVSGMLFTKICGVGHKEDREKHCAETPGV